MLHPALKNIRHVAMDLDGTLYQGGTLLPCTLAFLDLLKSLNIGRTFLTNNSSRSVEGYVHHLSALGIAAEAPEIQTSTLASFDHIREGWPMAQTLFVLGTPDMQEEVHRHGFAVANAEDEPDAVLVGFDTTLSFERLCRAAWWLRQGKPFIATHPDRVCPTDQPTTLVDCGAICACLTSATGRMPDAICGKPHQRMVQGIFQRHNLRPDEVAIVGDRLYTDVQMARNSGALGVLVLTGETTPEEATAADPAPDLVVESVQRLGELLWEARMASQR